MQPQPVEIVKQPPGPGFLRRLLTDLPTAIMTSILTTLLLALLAPRITAYVALVHPTCDSPVGLEQVPPADLTATGPTLDERIHRASRIVDGSVGSLWIPPLVPPASRPEGMSTSDQLTVFQEDGVVEVTLANEEDVQLVCVVNGLANSYTNYTNWGRVRTVEAWTDSEEDPRLSTLRNMSEGAFQNFQDVNVPTGDAKVLHLRLIDAYEGQQMVSVDPDVCGTRDEVGKGPQNDPIGCNRNATPKAGIAELAVYRQDAGILSALFTAWN